MPVLRHHEGTVEVVEVGDGRRRIRALGPDGALLPGRNEWVTRYPPELIEAVLDVKGPRWVCDEIMRDEDPSYVELSLRADLFAFVPERAFAGKRLLDFGCGSAASTMALGRMLPATEIVGAELVAGFVAVAEQRARHLGYHHVAFHRSPHGSALPDGIGRFDFIVLSAVLEHLLPHERAVLLPLLWSHLAPGGVLFINQTPHRWFPVERHTTGLPGLNYLPDRLALRAARRFASRVDPHASWDELLREGIRGGSEPEVVRRLRAAEIGGFRLLSPTHLGGRDTGDIWTHVARASGRRSGPAAWLLPRAYRLVSRVTGSQFARQLSMAVARPGGDG